MSKRAAVVLFMSMMVIAGCGKDGGDSSLNITENGTYDVSRYNQVTVNVGDGELESENTSETASEGNDEITLTRAQFRDFSMEVPEEFVEGFTEAELTENSFITLYGIDEHDDHVFSPTTMSILSMDHAGGNDELERYSDAPQEDVNGITMAIRHSHAGSQRDIEVVFIQNDYLYTVRLSFQTDLDKKYGEYADQFYRTIQMN